MDNSEVKNRLSQEELQLLAEAAKDEHSQAFEVVRETLGLPCCYRNALMRSLRETNWREADDPVRLIRRNLIRFAIAIPASERNEEPFSEHVGFDEKQHSPGDVEELPDEDDFSVTKRVRRKFVHMDRDRNISADPIPKVDWDAVGRSAGLDDLELEILTAYFWLPRGRALLLSRVGTDKRRQNSILAAWKRVERKIPNIKEIIENPA